MTYFVWEWDTVRSLDEFDKKLSCRMETAQRFMSMNEYFAKSLDVFRKDTVE